jgi:hypothetical protein
MTIVFRSPSDTGVKGDNTSISPITNGELITEAVLQRPDNNLRVRTDELSRVVGSLEYLLQTVTNSTTLLRYISNSNLVKPALLSVYYKEFSGNKVYYISPEVPSVDSTNGATPSLIVFGSSTNTFNYILNKDAFAAYYNQGDVANITDTHNQVLGLKDVGDSLCLRVPTVPTSYTGETFLPSSTSKALPAGEAEISSTLLLSLQNDALSAADSIYSIIKIPAKNSISITASSGSVYDFLEGVLALIGESGMDTKSLEVQGTYGANQSTGKYVLDLEGLSKSGNVYTLPRSGYRDFEELASLTITSFSFYINNSNTSAEDLSPSAVTVNTTTLLPPNEFLFPLAIHTGDGILIPNFGSVDTLDIETRGGTAFLDSKGVLIGETGTATRVFHTRAHLDYEALSTSVGSGGYFEYLVTDDAGVEYFRLPIDAYVPEAGEDTKIYLSNLEIQLVLDEVFSKATNAIASQVVRDVYISIGLFDLTNIAGEFKSSFGVPLSLLTCIPGKAEAVEDSYPNLLLSNFKLLDLKDDYIATVELPDSIRNTNALGKSLVVWIYRETSPVDDFFTTLDTGSINLDFRMEWSTRLGDYVNLASEASMYFLA